MSEESYKSFKDPVYGYIDIPSTWASTIVDTPVFQRLRCIAQTSYAPLYPSATHNRFVHSLGVYHLGSIVKREVENCSLPDLLRKKRADVSKLVCERYLQLFLLACLLHDVGHAPFSHTGEDFYIEKSENGQSIKLHDRIASLLCDKTFARERTKRPKPAAPHELMSIIVALTQFSCQFKSNAEKVFFARAVAGYPYDVTAGKNEDGIPLSLLNCLVSLLNSSIVDVDRLDYLIRDASTTGFKTVVVDYQRLLCGVRIRWIDAECKVVFTKRAVSVLENVVYAHDAERKWVQNHPAIGYEMSLLRKIFEEVNDKFGKRLQGRTLFCEAALGRNGVALSSLGKNVRLRYLSDADIVFLMKCLESAEVERFFDRAKRFAPLWKSEAEFCGLFNEIDWDSSVGKGSLKCLQKVLEGLLKSMRLLNVIRLDSKSLNALKEEVVRAKRNCEQTRNKADRILNRASIWAQKELFQKLVVALRSFAKDASIPFSFQLLNGKTFTSGFAKSDLSRLQIELGIKGQTIDFGKITKTLDSRDGVLPQTVYYLFCEKINGDKARLSRKLVAKLKGFVKDNQKSIEKVFG